jgi:hypothetical protein
MSRIFLTICLASHVIAGESTMDGQEQTPRDQYDAQAVRIETRWGNRFLVRGREGAVVGKIGSRGFDFPSALAASPNAAREAAEFVRVDRRANTLLAIGILAWGVGGGVARMDDIGAAVAIPAWTAVAGGTVLMVYGGVQLNKALTALSRSIWWYNRDLQPATP